MVHTAIIKIHDPERELEPFHLHGGAPLPRQGEFITAVGATYLVTKVSYYYGNPSDSQHISDIWVHLDVIRIESDE